MVTRDGLKYTSWVAGTLSACQLIPRTVMSTIDPKNGYVYWDDVGPDTKVPSAEGGIMSFDEINQARGPGFFGWPYFLVNNEAFPVYDFTTKKEGPRKDPLHPVNNSPNNTGLRDLPPTQPPMIWYAKGESQRFPLVGKGGASAMAGPMYYSNLYPKAPYKLPDYYDGKLFIYDWIRKWIMAVTLDEKGNYVGMEPFLSQLDIAAPVDMKIAPDGAIYLLAYGTDWFAHTHQDIPCVPALTDAMIQGDYEHETGNQIFDVFREKGLSYREVEMVLLQNHGPFTWGKTKLPQSRFTTRPCWKKSLEWLI